MTRKSRNVIDRDVPNVDCVFCDLCAGGALLALTVTASMFSKRKIPTASYNEFSKKEDDILWRIIMVIINSDNYTSLNNRWVSEKIIC
jgi:hypothetical protein